LLFVDAIQGLGVFPLDVGRTRIDFLAADGHKWLLGPEGAGLFYLRREHLELLAPRNIGWHSVVQAGQYDNTELALRSSALRYEGGTWNTGGILALGASLALLARYGTERLSGRVLELAELAGQRLQQAGAVLHRPAPREHRSGIVSFELPGHAPQALRQACLARGVALACRAGKLRISPHAYNDEGDLERLVAALREAQKTG
jgi:selenocysteine lyase/cysteine desulfurase